MWHIIHKPTSSRMLTFRWNHRSLWRGWSQHDQRFHLTSCTPDVWHLFVWLIWLWQTIYWESITATVLSTSFARKILINVTKTMQLVGTLAVTSPSKSHSNAPLVSHRSPRWVGWKQPFGKTTLESPMHRWRNSVPCEFFCELRETCNDERLTWKERTSSGFFTLWGNKNISGSVFGG